MIKKRELGQFFTIGNPFELKPFAIWFTKILNKYNKPIKILEPFAGANNIPELIQSIGFTEEHITWDCFDIDPINDPEINTSGIYVNKQDTLLNYPTGYDIAITNPPYLAKNTAKRNNLTYPKEAEKYTDLYLYAIEKMLKHNKYVAVIIPESFINNKYFKDRLEIFVSLTMRMFNDTDCPVCLALFGPDNTNDFEIYQNNKYIMKYSYLKTILEELEDGADIECKFNDPNGELGLYAIDLVKDKFIHFCYGSDINADITYSSRSITRISLSKKIDNMGNFIDKLNEYLNDFRNKTKDVVLTAFKGLRSDMKYRRRLDYGLAKKIIKKVVKLYGF